MSLSIQGDNRRTGVEVEIFPSLESCKHIFETRWCQIFAYTGNLLERIWTQFFQYCFPFKLLFLWCCLKNRARLEIKKCSKNMKYIHKVIFANTKQSLIKKSIILLLLSVLCILYTLNDLMIIRKWFSKDWKESKYSSYQQQYLKWED